MKGIKAGEARRLLEGAGFDCARARSHVIMVRDNERLVLPHTGQCSPWLTQQVLRLSGAKRS
jgi:predicted RNA binding protein YcfA (HicA-like mRNA interferase family)